MYQTIPFWVFRTTATSVKRSPLKSPRIGRSPVVPNVNVRTAPLELNRTYHTNPCAEFRIATWSARLSPSKSPTTGLSDDNPHCVVVVAPAVLVYQYLRPLTFRTTV